MASGASKRGVSDIGTGSPRAHPGRFGSPGAAGERVGRGETKKQEQILRMTERALTACCHASEVANHGDRREERRGSGRGWRPGDRDLTRLKLGSYTPQNVHFPKDIPNKSWDRPHL